VAHLHPLRSRHQEPAQLRPGAAHDRAPGEHPEPADRLVLDSGARLPYPCPSRRDQGHPALPSRPDHPEGSGKLLDSHRRRESQLEQGKAFVFDDTYEHEVFNNTEDERVILLFDFDRPMRFWGRIINKTFVTLLKFSAYYQEPKKNIKDFEERFEAAIRRADANLEKMSDAA
jgi:hypothetical protein